MGPGQSGALFKASDMTLMCLQAKKNKKQKKNQPTTPPTHTQNHWISLFPPFIWKANLEDSAVSTGLEKVSFHSNPKERQCQRMLKLPHNCTHLAR